jgi:hypothetical protein
MFARCERAVGLTLAAALQGDDTVNLRPMASQRVTELHQLAAARPGTSKQEQALQNALAQWRELEPKRAFLAHGEVLALIDPQGHWDARFDLTRYKGNEPSHERWTLSSDEAQEFEDRLADRFRIMSSQLGQLRKRLKP